MVPFSPLPATNLGRESPSCAYTARELREYVPNLLAQEHQAVWYSAQLLQAAPSVVPLSILACDGKGNIGTGIYWISCFDEVPSTMDIRTPIDDGSFQGFGSSNRQILGGFGGEGQNMWVLKWQGYILQNRKCEFLVKRIWTQLGEWETSHRISFC